jgi:hypothetical protein
MLEEDGKGADDYEEEPSRVSVVSFRHATICPAKACTQRKGLDGWQVKDASCPPRRNTVHAERREARALQCAGTSRLRRHTRASLWPFMADGSLPGRIAKPETAQQAHCCRRAAPHKFTALPRPQPAAVMATVILLFGAMSDLLSSDVAMRMSMGDEWLQATWDTCKSSNRCRPPCFSPRCRAWRSSKTHKISLEAPFTTKTAPNQVFSWSPQPTLPSPTLHTPTFRVLTTTVLLLLSIWLRFPYQAKLGLSLISLSCWFTVSTVVWLLYALMRDKRNSMRKTSRFNSYTNMSLVRSLFPRGATCLGLAVSSLMPFLWQISHIALDLECCESTIYVVSPKTEDGTQWGILQTRECNPLQIQEAWCGFGIAAAVLGAAAVALAGMRDSNTFPLQESLNPGKIVSVEESMSTLPSSQQHKHVMGIEKKLATPRGQPCSSSSSLFAGNTPRKFTSNSTRSCFSSSSLSTLSEHPEQHGERNLCFISVPLNTVDGTEFKPSPNPAETTEITIQRLDTEESGDIAASIVNSNDHDDDDNNNNNNNNNNNEGKENNDAVSAIETRQLALGTPAPDSDTKLFAPVSRAPTEWVVRNHP